MSAFTDEQRLAQIIELGLDTPDGSDLRLLCEAYVALQAKVARVQQLCDDAAPTGAPWLDRRSVAAALADRPEQVRP